MSKSQPYYIAVKIGCADEVCNSIGEIKRSEDAKSEAQYLLLTEIPCIEPWSEQIMRISIDDSRLLIKFQQVDAFTYPIYMCSTPSQIMYAVNIWLDGATIKNIVLNAPHLRENLRVTNAIYTKIRSIFNASMLTKITPGDDFLVNQMYYTYASRRFPITERSSASWKQLFISSHEDTNNHLIKIAKGIILTGSSENDSYTSIPNALGGESTEQYGTSIEEFLSRIGDKTVKPYVQQFFAWLESNYRTFDSIARQKILNISILIMKTGQIPSNREQTQKYAMTAPRCAELQRSEKVDIIDMLDYMISSDQAAMFAEFMCALLSCDRYMFILQMPRIMRYLTMCMQNDYRVTSLVAYAMTFVMFYALQMEATTKLAESSAPFVFSHDSICTFPVFDDTMPYVPVGVTNINHKVPFHIPGERRPVPVADIPNRLRASMVRNTSPFDIARDIPWGNGTLLLTGSRYASALWVGPRERDHYNCDYGKYIAEYIGNSCDILDEILANVDTSGDPLLDIIGTDFEKGVKCDHDESPKPACVYESEDTRTSQSPESKENKLIDEFRRIFPLAAPRESKSDAPQLPAPVPSAVNQHVRDLFCRLKFADDFNNHSDIDICHVGPEEEFDAATARFVMHLRQFGRAIALRFQKARTYTWVIVTDFLNYTIDMFHNHYGSGVNLVLNYMTSYPRCWFDGVSHFGTVEYVCARMSGINSRYIYTMNDPIYTLMKCARREDISTLLNFGEQTLVKKWVEQNMPGVKFILGNVSLTNNFFGKNHPAGFLEDNASKPWIFNHLVMPKSRSPLCIWSKENIGNLVDPSAMRLILGKKIVPARSTVFAEYMAELSQMKSATSSWVR